VSFDNVNGEPSYFPPPP